jgi:hypothetical protein
MKSRLIRPKRQEAPTVNKIYLEILQERKTFLAGHVRTILKRILRKDHVNSLQGIKLSKHSVK